MKRLLGLAGLCFSVFSLLVVSEVGLGQAQRTANTTEALAEELAVLKRTVVEQEKRITQLEALVKQLQQALTSSEPRPSSTPAALTSPSNAFPWHNPSSWDRLIRGMSQRQVIAILGQPTKIEGVAVIKLFYQGEVANSGFVTGIVTLLDDRVLSIDKPVFLR